MKYNIPKKLTSVLLACVMLVGLFPATAFAEGRTEVSRVVATSENGDITPEYGSRTAKVEFTVSEGTLARFPYSMGDWFKKTGEGNIRLTENDTFGEGTYYYSAQLRIDDATYVLAANGLKVIVDGIEWNVDSVSVFDTYSWAWVYSPDFIVETPPAQELTFHDSSLFDIGTNYVRREITAFSVAGNVDGGTAPYTFSKVSGPDWISVSATGKISGTPAVSGENPDLVVKVTDSKNAEKTINIAVADTRMNPDDRTKISVVTATSPNGDITPESGNTATRINFTVNEGKPAYLTPMMGGWYKKTDDGNIQLTENDTFGAGTYYYSTQLRIEENQYADISGITHVLSEDGVVVTVDGIEWEIYSNVVIGDSFSWVWVKSPEFTVTKPVIQAISIKGIERPVIGETAKTSGITTDNKGITLGSIQWYKQGRDSMTVMSASDKFELNKTYYLVITYNVSAEYTVSESAEILHNLTGGKATHNSENKTIIIQYKITKSSISGTVSSFGGRQTRTVLGLYDSTSDELIKTLTCTGTSTDYIFEDIETGSYTLKVTKDGHAERSYSITVDGSPTELDISIFKNGDTNMDGVIDVNDYQYIVNTALSEDNTAPSDTSTDEKYSVALCDYDKDGVVDVIDCFLVARLIEDSIAQ